MSRRLLAALAALLVIAAAAFAINRWVLDEDRTEVVALFDSTVGPYPGSDVQVLGVPVGTVTKVEPKDADARVTMALDQSQQVAADTGAVLVAPTLSSARFVQLTKPSDGRDKLVSGPVLSQHRPA